MQIANLRIAQHSPAFRTQNNAAALSIPWRGLWWLQDQVGFGPKPRGPNLGDNNRRCPHLALKQTTTKRLWPERRTSRKTAWIGHCITCITHTRNLCIICIICSGPQKNLRYSKPRSRWQKRFFSCKSQILRLPPNPPGCNPGSHSLLNRLRALRHPDVTARFNISKTRLWNCKSHCNCDANVSLSRILRLCNEITFSNLQVYKMLRLP